VTGPGRPVPMRRRSIRTTGMTSAAVPVRNTADRAAGFAGQFDHHVAGDALERAAPGGRGDHGLAAHDEEVVARGFGDEALRVEQDRFHAAGVDGLDLGQHVVEVVQALDLGAHRLRVVADRAHGDDGQPLLVERPRVELNGGGNDDDLGPPAHVRVQAQGPDAARHHQPDVAVHRAVGPAGADHGAGHGLATEGNGEVYGLGGAVQPVQVLLQHEDAAAVGADALEDAVAVEQAVIEHRDPRIARGHQPAVHVDFHGASPRAGSAAAERRNLTREGPSDQALRRCVASEGVKQSNPDGRHRGRPSRTQGNRVFLLSGGTTSVSSGDFLTRPQSRAGAPCRLVRQEPEFGPLPGEPAGSPPP
jgi:hypothetical protein